MPKILFKSKSVQKVFNFQIYINFQELSNFISTKIYRKGFQTKYSML